MLRVYSIRTRIKKVSLVDWKLCQFHLSTRSVGELREVNTFLQRIVEAGRVVMREKEESEGRKRRRRKSEGAELQRRIKPERWDRSRGEQLVSVY